MNDEINSEFRVVPVVRGDILFQYELQRRRYDPRGDTFDWVPEITGSNVDVLKAYARELKTLDARRKAHLEQPAVYFNV
jgi:hypothetical protein